MNVALTPQQKTYLEEEVASGRYRSIGEAVREALRLLQEGDALRSVKLDALRKDIGQGVRSLDAGEGRVLDMEAIKAKGRQIASSQG